MENHKFRGFRSPNTTPIPDELFDELMADLSGAELKVLLYICRRTFGFKKESDNISLNQMLRGITKKDNTRLDGGVGLSKPTLLRALRTLIQKKIILAEQRVSEEKGNEPTNYRLHLFDPLGKKMNQGEDQKFTKPLVKKNHPQDTVLQQTGRQQKYNNVWQKPVINQDQDMVNYYADLLAEKLHDKKSVRFYRAACARHNVDKLLQKAAEIVKDGQAKKPAAVFVHWLQEEQRKSS